jgi:DNA-binding SARP family transcriptional activator
MEFRILGPLQVLDADAEVLLGAPKERTLLAVLLLNAPAPVSRARLIEELWGESPPPTAARSLNVHVSQLRKALSRNGRTRIVTRAPGYAVEIEPDRLDASRFEQLVGQARRHVEAGELEPARRLLREALALWRGPPLDGLKLEAGTQNEIRRLDELRVAAQMDRIDCDLAVGLHEQLIGELEALVSEHPLRERLRAQLMLALYRAGRQADALTCYRSARETLVSELGIEPSTPLQRLERAILNQDSSLEAPAGLTLGPPGSTVALSGTVTVLFADAVQASRFVTLSSDQLELFLAEYQRLLCAVFNEFGGRELGSFYDTVSAAFATATQAGHAAIAAHRAIGAFQPQLAIKVALDAGDAADLSWSSAVALRCAQLCNEATGGQILLSDTVAQLLKDEKAEHALGAVAGRVRAYELVATPQAAQAHVTPSQRT